MKNESIGHSAAEIGADARLAEPESSGAARAPVDGVPINVIDGILPSLNGSLVVVDVVRSRVLSTCPTTSSPCGSHDVLAVTSRVWESPSAQPIATPGASR
jgi:hypothetical protein